MSCKLQQVVAEGRLDAQASSRPSFGGVQRTVKGMQLVAKDKIIKNILYINVPQGMVWYRVLYCIGMNFQRNVMVNDKVSFRTSKFQVVSKYSSYCLHPSAMKVSVETKETF